MFIFKMGHVSGKGLGKNLQGIQTPVEAKLRKGKAAIGYYGSERVPSKLPQAKVQVDSEEEEDREFQQQLQQWRKDEKVNRMGKFISSYVPMVVAIKEEIEWHRIC